MTVKKLQKNLEEKFEKIIWGLYPRVGVGVGGKKEGVLCEVGVKIPRGNRRVRKGAWRGFPVRDLEFRI